MELRQLKYFLKAKELLNFTQAAKHLYITQSTLSQQIKQLEQELNMPLFDRIGKRISLTEAGEQFAQYAQKSVDAAQEGLLLLNDLNTMNTGELKIGLTWGLKSLVLTSMKAFAAAYPKVKLTVTFGTTTELIVALNKQEIDFALTFFEGDHEDNLVYEPLMLSKMALIVSKHSSLASRKQITWAEVASLRLALPVKGFSTRNFLDRQFELHNIHPEIAVEVNHTSTVIDLVRVNAFKTILTLATVHGESGVCAIDIADCDMDREAVIITLKDCYQKRAVKIFIDLLLSEDKDLYNEL
ncbi:LysR substrate-binding domain-containing protein [Myroides pelagicus]|uniref:LysR family transcriptional regulator n=1 Tax=Myroides pelagicus TaxID=270914 RepID=A0A7K1GJV9_9FLAO|nr:LysR substrate-binding domain-containing protein [Myroides pelagicus]MEC4114101.1 LysR substrate-binding domain-containing protein [Myroides pelagicus]MTH29175.1 LysR family transcriptional regulator [Myroides pelagicus]